MIPENRQRIWQALIEEAMSRPTSEDVQKFASRMEKQGFILDFIKPSTVAGIPDREFFESVINYFNAKAGTSFKMKIPSSNATLILHQRRQGFTLEDFKMVIDKKCRQWVGHAQYANALTPETLFSSRHFENYLGQRAVPAQSTSNEPSQTQSTRPGGSLDQAVAGAKKAI